LVLYVMNVKFFLETHHMLNYKGSRPSCSIIIISLLALNFLHL
jgi:hypothetical protein